MATSLTWIFQLVDKISAPARAASNALAATDRALRDVGSGLASAGMQMHGWVEAIRDVTGPIVGLGKEVLKAQAFKEDTLLGLEVILKSKTEAQKVMDEAVDWAARTPFSTTQSMDWTKALIVRGFAPREASLVRTFAGDLGALSGRDEDVGRIINALGEMRGLGKLTGDTLAGLNAAGLSSRRIFDELARTYHTTAAGARMLMEAGRIDSGTAINAMFSASRKLQGGPLGTTLLKRSQSMSGLWSTLRSRPEELFMSIGGQGMTRVKAVLANLADTFDPSSASGGKVVAALTRLMDQVTELLLGPFQGHGGADKMAATIDSMTAAMDPLAKGLGVVGQLASWVWSVFDGVGTAIGWLASEAVQAWEQIEALWNRALGWRAKMKDVGLELLSGLADGMMTGLDWVLDALRKVSDTVVSTLKERLGIHSPSKVFEGLGLNVSAGFSRGIEAGSGGSAAAVEELVHVPRAASAGRSVTLAPGSVVVHVEGGGGADIETRVRDAVLQALGSAFEQLGLEAGVA